MTKELTDKPEQALVQRVSFFEVPLSLEELARQQGVKPFDFDELLSSEERWPEDESVDDFIASLHDWRAEGKDRSLL